MFLYRNGVNKRNCVEILLSQNIDARKCC